MNLITNHFVVSFPWILHLADPWRAAKNQWMHGNPCIILCFTFYYIYILLLDIILYNTYNTFFLSFFNLEKLRCLYNGTERLCLVFCCHRKEIIVSVYVMLLRPSSCTELVQTVKSYVADMGPARNQWKNWKLDIGFIHIWIYEIYSLFHPALVSVVTRTLCGSSCLTCPMKDINL